MSKAQNKLNSNQARIQRFEIRVKEHIDRDWSDWFEDISVTYTASGESVLTGSVLDQSALYGLLARIRDLNLTLISVNQALADETTKEKNKSEGSYENL